MDDQFPVWMTKLLSGVDTKINIYISWMTKLISSVMTISVSGTDGYGESLCSTVLNGFIKLAVVFW